MTPQQREEQRRIFDGQGRLDLKLLNWAVNKLQYFMGGSHRMFAGEIGQRDCLVTVVRAVKLWQGTLERALLRARDFRQGRFLWPWHVVFCIEISGVNTSLRSQYMRAAGFIDVTMRGFSTELALWPLDEIIAAHRDRF